MFSPDGKTLAALGSDAVRLWDVASGRQLRRLHDDRDYSRDGFAPFYRGAFAPDGKSLWLMREEGDVLRWDLTAPDKARLSPAPFDSKKSVVLAATPDGKALAAGTGDDVVLWDAATGREKARLKGHRSRPNDARFSADGKWLASVSKTDLILWEPATGKKLLHEQAALDDRGDAATPFDHVALSADGRALALGLYLAKDPSHHVRLWETATGKELWALPTKGLAPRGLALSHDGKALALAGQESLTVWDAATGKVRWQDTSRWRQLLAVAFSPDGRALAAADTWGVRLWDAATGREICPIAEHSRGVGAIRLSPDGRTLVTEEPAWESQRDDVNGVPRLWDAATGRRLLSAEDARLPAGLLSADGKTAASWGEKGGVVLWDAKTGKRRRHVAAGEKIAWYRFSPDGKHLLVQTCTPTPGGKRDAEYAVTLWEAATGKKLGQFDTEGGEVRKADFSPDGKRLATLFDDCIDLWDVGTRRRLHTFEAAGEERRVFSQAFSADGKLLVFVEWGGRIRLCRTADGKELPSLLNEQTKKKLTRGSFAFALTADGKSILTTDDHGAVLCWERATGGLRLEWRAHESRVTTVCVSADDKVLATTNEAVALTWDVGALATGTMTKRELTPKELTALWDDLGSDDAARAYRAVWALARDAERGVPLLKECLPAALKAAARDAEQAVADLAGKDATARDRAVEALRRMRWFAEPMLRRALAAKPDEATRLHLGLLLDEIEKPVTSPAWLRIWRALEALEHAGTPEARALLAVVGKEADGSRVAQEAKAALKRLAARQE
jgi:WD40 repeat protein